MHWKLLAIETSCDETAAAVLQVESRSGDEGRDPRVEVLSDVVASQVRDHSPYGGVVPELASRRHLTAILPVIRRALAEASADLGDVRAAAVTAGPGLVGSLLVGIQAAKAIADVLGAPVVGVHHLAGHLLSARLLGPRSPAAPPPFPYVALIASGGHTALYRVDGPERHETLGSTRDDAAGEAFDKVARLLGLAYPGGPAIDRIARGVDPGSLRLPRGLDRKSTLDFSFSGLKTAVAEHLLSLRRPPSTEETARIAAAFQRSVIHTLLRKSLAACAATGVPRLALGGGVAANSALREEATAACAAAGVELFLPDTRACTDNAAMIGLAALPRLLRGENDGPALAARPDWRLESR